MLPLCKTLQIGVNDLLSGERLCEDNYRKRAEENLMNLIEENRENKNRMLYSVLCGGVTVVAVSALVALASFLTIPVPARILLLLLAVLTGGDRSADFTVQELDGERRENGYAIPELQISRKENNE